MLENRTLNLGLGLGAALHQAPIACVWYGA
jgi:hypothetical protein